MKFLIPILILILSLPTLAQEEAPLEPPYTRAPAQNPPLEAPYTSAPAQAKAGVQDLSTRSIPKPHKIDEDSGDYYYDSEPGAAAIYYDFDNVPPISGSVFVSVVLFCPDVVGLFCLHYI